MTFIYVVYPSGKHERVSQSSIDGCLLKSLQELVGGDVQTVPTPLNPDYGIAVYVNDEGLIRNLPLNHMAKRLLGKITGTTQAPIYGPAVITSSKWQQTGDTKSLSTAQTNAFDAYFASMKCSPNEDDPDGSTRMDNFAALLNGTPDYIVRHTRVQNTGTNTKKVLEIPDTLDARVNAPGTPSSHECGFMLHLVGPNRYEITSTTMDDGMHCLSMHAYVDCTGKLVSPGIYNAFGFGFRQFSNQCTMDELYAELRDVNVDNDYWDMYQDFGLDEHVDKKQCVEQ